VCVLLAIMNDDADYGDGCDIGCHYICDDAANVENDVYRFLLTINMFSSSSFILSKPTPL
jgi:hypothetical protein